ncbi:hypothetical protein E1B28_009458 [Marasmius oreades]|uniref:AAA+ ATPase domain-containing protein n=1 Tax=Marasmius oreades TaxID=181124 RepID=A0A9P7RVR6_9AGAR|nr:uncharacterized protein E1B28_009458 [Marasmius oreades]KAG7090338.1 hypothetical protein E1B28_009458 [Marasmius oreades]
MGRASGMWGDFSFVLVRKIPQEEGKEPTFKIVIKSEYLLKACKDVIVSWPGVSWNSDPLEVDPEMFLTFLEEFTAYRDALQAKKRSLMETHILSSVNLLLNFLHTDFQTTIHRINTHKAHRETSFDLLFAILVPRTLLVTECAITGRPRLFKLMSWTRVVTNTCSYYQLFCESMDLVDHQATATVLPGRVQTMIILPSFKGTIPMSELDAYPLKYHAYPERLKEGILRRGRKWVDIIGVHHMEFDGIAAFRTEQHKIRRHAVTGRIMIDRTTFKRFNPNYKYPIPVGGSSIRYSPPIVNEWGDFRPPPPPTPPYEDGLANSLFAGDLVQRKSPNDGKDTQQPDLSEEELLLTSTVVYGFSLPDKLWLEFDVEKITSVQWNQEAFANLVLPDGRKQMLQALVEAHHQELGFDDFIRGKGHGLVINLFGPPGVGKTFSAEATSEHVKRPLYLVGAGDLGTDPTRLDAALERVFEVATAWKAIVLIDEADVFLEQRSLHDLDRNAMVAVFLRHVEYYRGILFLTTNRVKAFDEAFLSRIHVALHFTDLPIESKIKIWTAFIAKVGASDIIGPDQIEVLAKRDVNGRQIKNAVRTANSLAVGRGERLELRHFMDTLDAMEEFERDFESVRAN